EETRFRKTLARGIVLLDEASSGLDRGDILPGDVAFKLYDTFGFPLDLTQDALKPRGIEVDLAQFDKAMEKQREDARKAWAGSGDAATEQVWFELRERYGASEFLGYETETAEGKVLALVRDGAPLDEISQGDEAAIILNQTPFYGESGGQVGDKGRIAGAGGTVFRVDTTQKKADGLFVHIGQLEKGTIKVGDAVELEVDHSARTATRTNHSATHLLHEALRRVLGDHVAQKGSFVGPGRLRFDFSHPKPVSDEEIAAVESKANAMILQNSAVETRLMDVNEAIEAGAIALFGEKYGDEVRVVSMGTVPEGERAGKPWSVELCGGTHVRRTGDIGLVDIVGESAVAAGVRRIEALTGNDAREYLSAQETRLREAASLLKIKPEQLVPRLEQLLDERRKLEREAAEARKRLALGGGGGGNAAIRTLGAVKFLARRVEGVSAKDLRGLVDEGKKQIGSGVVAVIGLNDEGKAALVVGVTQDLTPDYNAVELVKTGAEALGGQGGGGRPDMAQAGGPNGADADAALEAIAKALSEETGA
ncbi:MAG TPA: alanine--tRNA ligase, partial [Rhizobiales bacterium]|nr:alanine--tRNA ligase [Hyphomicrobiales bacterium]